MLSLACLANGNILTERYNQSFINLDNGLPHNNVSWLFTDSNGFLWIATYGGGLVRYDGFNMMTPALGLKSLSCKSVAEDRFKRLWVAFDEGTNVINLNTMLPIVPKTASGDISELLSQPGVKTYCDALGRIWLITTKHVNLITFDENGRISQIATYKYTDNTPEISVCDIEGNGNVWIGIDRGLYRMVEKNGQLIREEISPLLKPLYGLYITDMLKRGNVIWFSTNHGLFRYDPYLHQLEQIPTQNLSHEFLSRLALMPDNTLLVGSLCGVNIYDDKTESFTAWTQASNPPLKNDFVHNLWVDKGLIYIGTEAGGVIRLVPRQLLLQNSIHTADPGSLSPNPVNAMYAAPDGTLWVGTVEGGLNRRLKGERNFIHYTKDNSALPHNSVSTLAADGYGRLWIGTWGGGLCWIDMKNPQTIVRLNLPPEQARLTLFIGAMTYDHINNGMWIGSNDGMFFYSFKTNQLVEPFEGCQLERGCIGSIITKDGHLWMGCMRGVVIVDLKSEKNGKFENRAIRHLLSDPKSKIVDKISSFC
jgi:ligand-binding sensor domain-containing protein